MGRCPWSVNQNRFQDDWGTFFERTKFVNIDHWRICVTIKRLIITHVHDNTRIMIRKLVNLSVLRVFLFAVKLTIHHVHRKNYPKFMAIRCWWQMSVTTNHVSNSKVAFLTPNDRKEMLMVYNIPYIRITKYSKPNGKAMYEIRNKIYQ